MEKSDVAQTQYEGWEIDWSLLKIGEKVAVGSCGDLLVYYYMLNLEIQWIFTFYSVLSLYLHFKWVIRYRGVYLGQDVAIKVLRSEHLNSSLGVEFAQEVAILR